MKYKYLCVLLLLLMMTCPGLPVQAEDAQLLTIGTGSVNGVFYPVGQGICTQVNIARKEHGIRCRAYSTGAAVYNLNSLATGELDLGITYANLARDAYDGKGVFTDIGPDRDLRAVIELYPMVAGVIVKDDMNIHDFSQISGHRINIGNIGSGKRAVADALIEAGGLSLSDFISATEWSTDKVERAFCDGELDVIVEAMAVDSPFFKKVTSECGGRFISISTKVYQKLNQISPGFSVTILPGGKFINNPEPFSLLEIRAVLVSHVRTSAQAIQAVLGSLLDNPETLGLLHPILKESDFGRLLNHADFIPRHSGVQLYLRSASE